MEQEIDDWLAEHQDEVLAEAKVLALKAQENEELMGRSEALAAMAEGAIEKTAAFEEAKRTAESLEANQRVNVGDMLAIGSKLASELAVTATTMDEKERDAVLGDATKVLSEVGGLAEGSEAIQKLVKEGEKVYDEHAGELEEAEDAVLADKTYGAQISHLKTEGERIAADIATRSITTPEEALALLQENEKFVDELTDLALRYIEDAVCSIEIPPITGEKDWGNYRIAGLGVKRFTVDTEGVTAEVTELVRIAVKGIQVEFDAFDFSLEKTSFPKVKDEGKADTTATVSAFVQFGISTGAEKNIAVDQVQAQVNVDALPVTVIAANHRWLFNTLLSVFADRVRDGVQQEVVAKVDEGVQYLDEQLGAVMARIVDSFSAHGEGLLAAAEQEVGGAPEPEPA